MKKTPKLRFKEFSRDWEEKKLGTLGEFRKTYSFSRSVEGEGSYKHIHYGDIHMNYKGIISKNKSIPSIDIPNDNYEIIQERDIIFADASEDRKDLGKVAVVRSIEGNVISGLHTICFRPKDDLNSEFFLNHSLNKEYLKYMYTRGNGAKVLGISKSNLSEYKFLVPSIEEQEKIAKFFSLIDNKISLQSEKVEALKDYKKGIMQKIFSRELRFKDDEGRDYPEWEEKNMNKFLIERKEKNTGSLRVCSVAVKRGVVDQIEHLGRSFAAKDTSNYNLVKYGDIVYTKSPTGDFPYGIIKQSLIEEDVVVSPLYGVFKPLNFNLGYILHCYFEYRENANNYLYSIIQKGAKNTINISNTTFLSKSIRLPIDENEQRKIVNLLLGIERKIEKEQEKLNSLNEYKKGLLQQMFI